MSYSTIYTLDGSELTTGIQSQAVCDETVRTAAALAQDRGESVVVEDRGTEECYCVSPVGKREAAPEGWVPEWNEPETEDDSPC